MVNTFTTNAPEETRKVGMEVVETAGKGDVFGLEGKLGAGKTVFVTGMAEGLGLADPESRVTSPTYTLQNIYECSPNLIHCDAYRLQSDDQLQQLGWPSQFPEGITAIEWAEKLRPGLDSYLTYVVSIERQANSENVRTIEVRKFEE